MCNLPRDFPRNICAYCGSEKKLSDDHVPPKNLFPKPRPSDLITVPACNVCHSRTSKDDEYFRLKLCLRDDAGEHESARANWDSIFRSLKKENAKGLKSLFLSDLRRIQLYTPTGLYIRKSFAYDVDLKRIRNVIERTIRGLYFAEMCNPLDLNNEVRVYGNDDLELQPRDIIEDLIKMILIPLKTIPAKIIGNGVFLYHHRIMEENPLYSVWLVTFYESVLFFGMTGHL